ncbi:MAG: ABC transporter permease [SAR202 cluster bacterium Casp-Chloro-G4]|nr:ABC transporter permease [Chloroflexota bacterium]MDA1228130.1 ABC transporter permease [Chloroflexota bacterium]PKB62055.1 MAG: ABC transporter permease [SAR202 cluster bacterium Casp-Chloro-G4]
MRRIIVRRISAMLFVMLAITILVFALSRLSGDPRYLYMSAYTRVTSESWEAQGKAMGLDKPMAVQYLVWLKNAVQGDFGESVHYRRNSLLMIVESLPATLQLSGVSFVFAILLGLPLGMLSAVKRMTVWDYFGRSFALLGQATPPFWIAIVLVLVFSVQLDWLPTSRRGDWTHYVLPVATLAWLPAAGLLRLTRSSMLEVLDSEYIKLAKAKGVGSSKIIWKHALRNALIAPLTFAATLLAGFLTGTVVIETVFAWPGLGRLAVQAALNTDFPLITGLALVFAVVFLLCSMAADILYALIDPRIRFQ